MLEILPACRKGWFKTFPFNKWSDNPALHDKLLVGKPTISAFLGISEKTLKRWFKKYPELPILRCQYRCYAITNELMLWRIRQHLRKLLPSQFDAAYYRIVSDRAEHMGVTLNHFVAMYITQSRFIVEPPIVHKRLRKTGHYRKTIDRTLKLLFLNRILTKESLDI